MSRTITLIAVVGAALAVVAPSAWGAPDPWSDGMNRAYRLGEYSPEARADRLRSEGLNKLYGLGKWATPQIGTAQMPDVVDRAVVAEQKRVATMLDARERSFQARREVQIDSLPYPDVFERTVAARERSDHFLAADDRFRIDHTDVPAPVTVGDSGREIEWPQVGVGFGVAFALLLGLLLMLRSRRHQPIAR